MHSEWNLHDVISLHQSFSLTVKFSVAPYVLDKKCKAAFIIIIIVLSSVLSHLPQVCDGFLCRKSTVSGGTFWVLVLGSAAGLSVLVLMNSSSNGCD